METVGPEQLDVTQHYAVGSEDQVVLGKRRRLTDPALIGVNVDIEVGGKLGGLALPVEEERAWHHNQATRRARLLLVDRLEEGQGLNGVMTENLLSHKVVVLSHLEIVDPALVAHLIDRDDTPEVEILSG